TDAHCRLPGLLRAKPRDRNCLHAAPDDRRKWPRARHERSKIALAESALAGAAREPRRMARHRELREDEQQLCRAFAIFARESIPPLSLRARLLSRRGRSRGKQTGRPAAGTPALP